MIKDDGLINSDMMIVATFGVKNNQIAVFDLN